MIRCFFFFLLFPIFSSPMCVWGYCHRSGAWLPATYWTNPQFKIRLNEVDNSQEDGASGPLCTVLLGLMQKNRRRKKRLGQGMLSIGYAIYKVLPSLLTLDIRCVPDGMGGNLGAGDWKAFPTAWILVLIRWSSCSLKCFSLTEAGVSHLEIHSSDYWYGVTFITLFLSWRLHANVPIRFFPKYRW